uniref:Uncharacterized protein n=1 Tax=Rangifer tarandus platyrhynchus TaxID=3082113 RepID=A0ACB0F469_RANTA|nr:unnamed protein product [Rangifer tarandus platyrhynchus]
MARDPAAPKDRGAAPGSGSALALQARVQPCLGRGADTDRRGPGRAQRDRLHPSGRRQGRTDCGGFLSKSRLYGNKVIQPFLPLQSLEEQFLNNFL